MPFHDVYQQPHKTFVDIIGIVVHLEPLKYIGGRPYREARNALRWALAKVDKNIIIATMMRRNNKYRCLETSDYSTIHFNPDHHTTSRLQIIRHSLIQNPRSRAINNFLENRQAQLTTMIPD
uniref:Uncharacterized protein n=1 Tax=Zea mays TaxID=4577 RepID=A0A804NVR3_MAIZE